MTGQKFQNGDVVKDIVSGYVGMIVATTLWLNGCYRYTVQPREINKETGKPTDDCAFDEHQLILVKATAFQAETKKATKHDTGGPRPTPRQPMLRR